MLIHPKLPDPTAYFAQRRKKRRLEIAFRVVCGALGVAGTFFLFGLVLFSAMPE